MTDGHAHQIPRTCLLVSVDVVLFTLGRGEDARRQSLQVLLGRRDHEPYKGEWALPGSFVREDEGLNEAAQRVVHDIAGASGIYLEQLFTFGEPDRDPRGRVITAAYYALVHSDLVGRASAPAAARPDERVVWFAADAPPERLAFDHRRILDYALWRLRNKIEYTDIAFQFLPERFTLTHLRQVYEAVLGEPLDKRNFNRKVLSGDLVAPTDDMQVGQAHRPARLYSFVRRQPALPGAPG